jgi:hypothetical protein
MPKKPPPQYRLQLQNRWTESVDELVAETEYITRVLATFGLKPRGFDPGISVYDAEDPYGRGNASVFDIPIWFFRRLEAAVQILNELESNGSGGYNLSQRDYFDPVAVLAKIQNEKA